jgi:hypothetical protein
MFCYEILCRCLSVIEWFSQAVLSSYRLTFTYEIARLLLLSFQQWIIMRIQTYNMYCCHMKHLWRHPLLITHRVSNNLVAPFRNFSSSHIFRGVKIKPELLCSSISCGRRVTSRIRPFRVRFLLLIGFHQAEYCVECKFSSLPFVPIVIFKK